ncbi:MAG: DEAD/DEAH box helicase, partial [Hydrogenobaculum sp.]
PKLFSGFDKVLISKNINPIYLSFVDESGMANVYLPFPIVSLSEKVVSVGDPLQLPPVVSLSESVINDYYENSFFYKMKNISEDEKLYYYNRYSPTKTSVYHRTARCDTGKFDDIGQAVFLDEHRRCQKPIAELFQRLAGYKNMNIKTTPISGDALEKLKKFTNEEGIHLMFYDVKGERGPTDKTNKGEVLAISNIIDNLIKAGYTEKDIGIITPFLDQEIYIRRSLGRYRNIEIGTVHKFQGKEFPVIIFSTVVFSEDQLGKVKFFNSSPNLLNVAISRAKHLFVVVGNLNILEKSGAYLKSMISFFKENKSCKVISNNQ